MSAPKVVLYHNPACSKSRDAVAALKTRKVDTEIVEYLKAPLTEEELLTVLNKLGGDSAAKSLVRSGDPAFRESPFALDSAAAVAKALAATPKLMERPLAVVGNKAAVGRPLENILAILPKAEAKADEKADEETEVKAADSEAKPRGGKKAAPAATEAAGSKAAKPADGVPVRRSPRTAAAAEGKK